MPLKLVKMSERRSRDSISVLTVLLEKAKRGEVDGMVVCARLRNGDEEILVSDWYRRQLGRAANAVSRMYWRVMQMQDAVERGRLDTGR